MPGTTLTPEQLALPKEVKFVAMEKAAAWYQRRDIGGLVQFYPMPAFVRTRLGESGRRFIVSSPNQSELDLENKRMAGGRGAAEFVAGLSVSQKCPRGGGSWHPSGPKSNVR